jgi:predicted transcriptional regulator
MIKNQLNIRINADLLSELDNLSEETGKTKTAIISEALASHLGLDIAKTDTGYILKRLEALEAKFESLNRGKPEAQPKPVVDKQPKSYGELVTIEQAAEITGYAVSTLSSKLSRAGVQVVERVDGNRAGLYSKAEILDKVGINPIT